MERLSTFKPAQTLLLINKKASLRELLKITCMDLVLRNVLTVMEITKQVAPNQHPRKLTFIKTGERFSGYRQANYERVLLVPFNENRNIEILFNTFMARSYERARSEKRFKKLVFESNPLGSYYSQNIVERVMGGYSLTEPGEKLRTDVEEEIAALKSSYIDLKRHPDGIKELGEKIGGNIVLVTPEAINAYQDYSFKVDSATTAANGSDLLMWIALSEWSDDFVPASGSGFGADDFDAD